MSDMTIDTILECWRADTASAYHSRKMAAGDAFERLSIAFLTYDPEQRLQYRNIRHFADWAAEHGNDTDDDGIDLVAEIIDGEGLAAIRRIVHLSVETVRIVDGLPSSFEEGQS